MSIKVSQLSKEIAAVVKSYSKEIEISAKEAEKIVAQDTVKTLKQTSPKNKGEYRKAWTYKSSGRDGTIIFSKDPEYRLTHLLENPHKIKSKSGARMSTPQKHIEPAEQLAIAQLEGELIRRLSQ